MLRRGVIAALSRPLFSNTALKVKVGKAEQVIKKTSTFCNYKILANACINLRKTGKKVNHEFQAYAGLHDTSSNSVLKHSVKFFSCGELTNDNVGDHVELHGSIIFEDDKITLSDESGAVELIFTQKGKSKWINTLKGKSFVRLTGLVKEKATWESNIKSKEVPFVVLVNHIISASLHFEKPQQPWQSLRLELLPEELSRCNPSSMHFFFRRSHTCGVLNQIMVGNDVTLCGWVHAKHGKHIFTLKDGHGSVLVNCTGKGECPIPGAEKIDVNDLIFLKGVISFRSDRPKQRVDSKGHAVQVLAKEMKVVQDSDMKEDLEAPGSSGFLANSVTEPEPEPEPVPDPDPENLEETNFYRENRRCKESKKNITLPDRNRYALRSHNCGDINESLIGQTVYLMGWALYVRMDKFIVLSDKYGTIQLTVPDSRKDLQKLLKDLPPESVISVKGTVSFRPRGLENKFMKTGDFEVCVEDMQVISKSSASPLTAKSKNPSNLFLLQYRYLNLRHSLALRKALHMRCNVLHKMRKFLIENVGFVEVETPTLFRRTPGGAQEFVVPTRNKGEFYSLVQSPQQFKQLLMIGGMDRYFQIARCYRDETGQRDRQPEFTQLDIEMSFCDREGVLNLMEDLIKFIWPQDIGPLITPFPRLTYKEAMDTYGSDKPDTRFDCKIKDVTDAFRSVGAKFNRDININRYLRSNDFAAHAFVIRSGTISYSFIKNLVKEKREGLRFPIFVVKAKSSESTSPIAAIFSESVDKEIRKHIRFEPEDIILLGLGPKMDVLKALGEIRTLAGSKFDKDDNNLIDMNGFNFLWILDFPLFEVVNGQMQSVHHPFTNPHPDDVHMLHTEPLKVRSLHYDLVLNGSEVGGGSIRIHDAAFQKEVLENILKLDVSSLKHLLEALDSGAPIHGGFALGIDRFIAHLCGLSHITDVIAFPKTSSGRDPMSGAPAPLSDEDKALYHIL